MLTGAHPMDSYAADFAGKKHFMPLKDVMSVLTAL